METMHLSPKLCASAASPIKDNRDNLHQFGNNLLFLLVELDELSEPYFTNSLSRPRNAENTKIPETKDSE